MCADEPYVSVWDDEVEAGPSFQVAVRGVFGAVVAIMLLSLTSVVVMCVPVQRTES